MMFEAKGQVNLAQMRYIFFSRGAVHNSYFLSHNKIIQIKIDISQ